MLNFFDFSSNDDFSTLLMLAGEDVRVNGEEKRVIITNETINENYDDRKIHAIFPLNRGDVVEWEGKKFLVISEQNASRYGKYKAIMRRMPFEIVFNSDCYFVRSSAYVEALSFKFNFEKFVELNENRIVVVVPETVETKKIKENARFFVNDDVFIVKTIDNYTKPGLINIYAEKDLIGTDDVNNIAGYGACRINFADESIALTVGQSYPLAVNGLGPIRFESSDENVAVVNDQGIITAVGAGTATITARNATMVTIFDSVNVTVSNTVTYSISIEGSTEIYNNQSKSYTARVYANGVETTEKAVSWALFADDRVSSTTLATITSISGNSCTIKAGSNQIGYVQLRASLVDDPAVMAWLRIRVRSIL